MILLDNSTIYIFLILLNLLFVIVVGAFMLLRMDKNKILHRDFILGHWQRKGTSPTTGQSWFLQYHFDRDTVQVEGDPTVLAKSKYRIVSEIENLLTLELYEIENAPPTRKQKMQIHIDSRAQRISINGKEFVKTKEA